MSKTLNRSIETWKKSDPTGMSSMSKAAIFYALQDAKHDILLLASIVEKQTEIIRKFQERDGPEFSDGHDCDGFIGGCERFGCPGGDKCTAL